MVTFENLVTNNRSVFVCKSFFLEISGVFKHTKHPQLRPWPHLYSHRTAATSVRSTTRSWRSWHRPEHQRQCKEWHRRLQACWASDGQIEQMWWQKQCQSCKQETYIFTALHGMQTRSSDEISVCPSVRPSVRLSVRLSNACIVTKRKKNLSRFLYRAKDHSV